MCGRFSSLYKLKCAHSHTEFPSETYEWWQMATAAAATTRIISTRNKKRLFYRLISFHFIIFFLLNCLAWWWFFDDVWSVHDWSMFVSTVQILRFESWQGMQINSFQIESVWSSFVIPKHVHWSRVALIDYRMYWLWPKRMSGMTLKFNWVTKNMFNVVCLNWTAMN